ncbi:MAG: hypothetical protein JXA30_01795 [Deltaproteobacteria bacterium]|nr:hypothetical protein [Deltaproteobacteria bacterium]
MITKQIRLSIVIGDLPLCLYIPNTKSARSWNKLLKPYLCSAVKDFLFILNLELNSIKSKKTNSIKNRLETITRYSDDFYSLNLEFLTFYGSLSYRPKRYEGNMYVFRDVLPCYNDALWVCLSIICSDRGQLLLHASGVNIDGRVWLFCGPSGSGKTTIALKLRHRGVPFSDDRVIVEPCEDGSLKAFSTPFGSDVLSYRNAQSGIVEGICFIEQGDQHRLSLMKQDEIVSKIFPQIACFSRDPSVLDKVMSTISLIAENRYCYSLTFREDESFWPLLYNLKDKTE